METLLNDALQWIAALIDPNENIGEYDKTRAAEFINKARSESGKTMKTCAKKHAEIVFNCSDFTHCPICDLVEGYESRIAELRRRLEKD